MKMLAPTPAKRLQSMGAVRRELAKFDPKTPWVGIAAAASAVLVAAFFANAYLFAPPPDSEQLRSSVLTSLKAPDCSWLALESLSREGDRTVAKLSGVAGAIPAATREIENQAGRALEFDTTDVRAVQSDACGPLNAFRRFRESSEAGPSLAIQQTQFRLGNDPKFCVQREQREARVSAALTLETPDTDFTLLGFESNGHVQQLIPSRADFEAARASNPELALNLGGNIYQLSFCVDEATASRTAGGLVGLVLVKGTGPFALGLDPNAPDSQPVAADWPAQFIAQAEMRNWRTQVAWYEVLTQ